MASKVTKPKKKEQAEFSVGDKVSFMFGVRRRRGLVVEDRGPIGYRGRRLFGVRFPAKPKAGVEPTYTELPADRLKAV